MSENKDKGYTIVYFPWEDLEGKPRVAGRFKTKEEKDEYIKKIYDINSGWMDEELSSILVINDYNYILPM